eukprot:TRINITY_DN5484_c0_g1_i1.p1 TRINITY_DN5484_c0_g1~~TRINITY_DN5484_c0_g1_i1.p1  ORF type:complete len:307 (-),score=65.23 TRINITY_DN5484_c0_g1_i1:113-1033(-)
MDLPSFSAEPPTFYPQPPPYGSHSSPVDQPLPSYQDYIVSSQSSENSISELAPRPEVQNLSKKCKNCSKFYFENQNTATSCTFHPGRFCGVGWISNFSSFQRWSCCKEFFEGQPGCKVGYHVEDVRTSMMLNLFEAKCAAAEARNGRPEQANLQAPTALIPPAQEAKPKQDPQERFPDVDELHGPKIQFVRYEIQPTDTIQGIALKAQISISQILRDNNLIGYNISHRHHLWIRTKDGCMPDCLVSKPKEYQPNKRTLEQRFRQMTLASVDDAKCYLEMSDYDIGEAVKAYKSDLEWERQQKPKGL